MRTLIKIILMIFEIAAVITVLGWGALIYYIVKIATFWDEY